MSDKTCSSCKYFIQHYGLQQHRLYRLHCGHCTKNIGIKKTPCDNPCKNYAESSEISDVFVTKTYLSKSMLDYILRMDLLPEIMDAIETI